MSETAASADSRLRIRDSATIEDRDSEIAIYMHDLGGGSVLRGMTALMFRSLHIRFGIAEFTTRDAAEDSQAGDIKKWGSFLGALTDRGILVAATTKPGATTTSERLLVRLDSDAVDVERLTALVSSAANVEIASSAQGSGSSSAINLAVRLDYQLDPAGVLAFARRQAELRYQSLAVRVYGHNVELGPWTVPGRTPCFECYWSRLQAGRDQRPPESFLRAAAPSESRQAVRTIATEAAMALLAGEIIKAAAGAPPVTMGQVVRLDLANLELVKHKVVSVPPCATCAAAFRAEL